ncbi:alcohol acetyltransferase-domain-containing protein [Thelonectria olida]|uniref:Alcohol acetyltransferase-domain-containing protein n=1 Tax=Thelonectria olida TaxID=1576542 RepID=A0A9P8VYQ4_9HYPO|nr:alcohol acetyltransferase-domain-containing protein [Thelonectria olida]
MDNYDGPPYYTVMRPSNYLDRMFYLQHRVGVQANILVSAHYAPSTSTDQTLLSRDAVFSAVRSVIAKYPELSIIGVPEKVGKKGHHALNLAALHEIDIETCVEFLDDEAPSATAQVVERLHNTWNWTDKQFNPRQPWWKVYVLGRQEVVFVFHHLVCDGRFGHFFHRQFLAGLNSFDEKDASSNSSESPIIKIDMERVKLEKEVQDFWLSSTYVIRVVHIFLSFVFLRLFLGNRLLFTGLPKAPPYSKSVEIEASPEQRTKTRIASLRISAPRMRRIIEACRERKTTFTPLLLSMMLAALACDYYPDAKVGMSNFALDMRGVYPQGSENSGKLLSCAGGGSKWAWLDRYRRVFPRADGAKNKDEDVKAKVDKDAAWALVKEYGATVAECVKPKGSSVMVMFKAANSMTNDLEGMLGSNFPALGLHLQNCFQVSNLGVFATGDKSGPWKIDDMCFSASAINGNICYNLSLGVTGAEGGDTVILACYENEVMGEDLVSGILEKTLEKIEAIC